MQQKLSNKKGNKNATNLFEQVTVTEEVSHFTLRRRKLHQFWTACETSRNLSNKSSDVIVRFFASEASREIRGSSDSHQHQVRLSSPWC